MVTNQTPGQVNAPDWRTVRVVGDERQAGLRGDGTCVGHEQPDDVGNRHLDHVAGPNPASHPLTSSFSLICGREKATSKPAKACGR